MSVVKFSEITLDMEEVKATWGEHELISANLVNLVSDFNMYHNEAVYESEHSTPEERTQAKTSLFMTFITGVLSAVTVESNFRKGYEKPESTVEKESEDFANTILS